MMSHHIGILSIISCVTFGPLVSVSNADRPFSPGNLKITPFCVGGEFLGGSYVCT